MTSRQREGIVEILAIFGAAQMVAQIAALIWPPSSVYGLLQYGNYAFTLIALGVGTYHWLRRPQ